MSTFTHFRWRTLAIAFVIALLPVSLLAATAWPAEGSVEIGNGFLAEPSGAVVHGNQLYVVDDGGYLAVMNADGSQAQRFTIGGDLEGITTPDVNGDILYLGVERPDSIVEFSTATHQKTGNTWNLTQYMNGSDDNQGLEALTYANGLVYAGMQQNGGIYVFRLRSAGAFDHVATIASPTGYSDLSGLHFDGEVFWAAYDSRNILASLTVNDLNAPTNFTVNEEFAMPGGAQEGVAFLGNDLFIAQDSGQIWKYIEFLKTPAPAPEPEPTPVPEPEVLPDYSVAVSYEINKSDRKVFVTYASGDVLEIKINNKLYVSVLILEGGEYVVVTDNRRVRVYQEGVLVRTVRTTDKKLRYISKMLRSLR